MCGLLVCCFVEMKINDFSLFAHRHIQTIYANIEFSSYRNFLMFFIQVRFAVVLEMDFFSVFLSFFPYIYFIQIYTVPLFFIHKLFEPFLTDKGGRGGLFIKLLRTYLYIWERNAECHHF